MDFEKQLSIYSNLIKTLQANGLEVPLMKVEGDNQDRYEISYRIWDGEVFSVSATIPDPDNAQEIYDDLLVAIDYSQSEKIYEHWKAFCFGKGLTEGEFESILDDGYADCNELVNLDTLEQIRFWKDWVVNHPLTEEIEERSFQRLEEIYSQCN